MLATVVLAYKQYDLEAPISTDMVTHLLMCEILCAVQQQHCVS